MKSVLRRSRRQVSLMLTAVLLATAFAVVLPARADARRSHCKMPCHHCQTSGAMTCCDNNRSEPSSLPLQTETAARASQQLLAVQTFAGTTSTVAAPSTTPALLLLGPPHGHRSTDLPILNSIFLI